MGANLHTGVEEEQGGEEAGEEGPSRTAVWHRLPPSLPMLQRQGAGLITHEARSSAARGATRAAGRVGLVVGMPSYSMLLPRRNNMVHIRGCAMRGGRGLRGSNSVGRQRLAPGTVGRAFARPVIASCGSQVAGRERGARSSAAVGIMPREQLKHQERRRAAAGQG